MIDFVHAKLYYTVENDENYRTILWFGWMGFSSSMYIQYLFELDDKFVK